MKARRPNAPTLLRRSLKLTIVILTDFRHTCEQHEGMAGYGWDEYDVRQGGRQTIHDAGNSIDITTEFVKVPGGNHGGSWGVRIKGTPRDDAPEKLMSTVIFYAGMEGFGSLNVNNEKDDLGIEGVVKIEGSSNELGDFSLEVNEGPDTNMHPRASHPSYANKPLDRSIVTSLQVPEGNMWQAKRTSIYTLGADGSLYGISKLWLTCCLFE